MSLRSSHPLPRGARRGEGALVPLLAACALALGACKSGPPTLGDPPPKLDDSKAESAYRDILGRHTGTGEIYSGFSTQLFAGATYQSWPFREARVRRVAQFKGMGQEEVAAELAKERADWEQFHEFELGAWTRDRQFDDFDKKNSVWRIALSTGQVELLPVEVSRVSKVNQDVRALYPYMGEFWVRYRVRFPKTSADGQPLVPPGTRELTLRLGSTLGQAELRTGAE